MLSRRELMWGGATFSVAGGEAAAQRADDDVKDGLRAIAQALDGVRVQQQVATQTVSEIRDRQRGFLRLNQRFPQCIDVGIRVWERMQDWHIAHQRPLAVSRGVDGHWQMDFIMTVLVLKMELSENEVGQAYDR